MYNYKMQVYKTAVIDLDVTIKNFRRLAREGFINIETGLHADALQDLERRREYIQSVVNGETRDTPYTIWLLKFVGGQ